MTPTDEELFLRYRSADDEEAFEDLYDRYGSAIYRFLRRLIRDSVAAEDLTQQTFLRVHEARASFDPRRSFRTWIFTIARRLAINWLQHSARNLESQLTDAPLASPSPEEQTLMGLELARVERALAELPTAEAEVLVLRKFEGMPFAEIATVLGCSVGAVKMRAHRGLLRLEAALRHLEQGGRG